MELSLVFTGLLICIRAAYTDMKSELIEKVFLRWGFLAACLWYAASFIYDKADAYTLLYGGMLALMLASCILALAAAFAPDALGGGDIRLLMLLAFIMGFRAFISLLLLLALLLPLGLAFRYFSEKVSSFAKGFQSGLPCSSITGPRREIPYRVPLAPYILAAYLIIFLPSLNFLTD